MNIQDMLDELANYQAQVDVLALQKQELIDALFTPEIKAEIEGINYEFQQKTEAAQMNIAHLTEEIKTAVLVNGSTVKSTHLMAVWNKGRVSWDSKKLDGMMALVPGLAAARSEGEPSVTIRKV